MASVSMSLCHCSMLALYSHVPVCVCVCVCVCLCEHELLQGVLPGLLYGARLNTGVGEGTGTICIALTHCPELHLLILYQQTERRLGQLCCS